MKRNLSILMLLYSVSGLSEDAVPPLFKPVESPAPVESGVTAKPSVQPPQAPEGLPAQTPPPAPAPQTDASVPQYVPPGAESPETALPAAPARKPYRSNHGTHQKHRYRNRRDAYLNPAGLRAEGQVFSEEIDNAVANGQVVRSQPGVTDEVVIARKRLNKLRTPYANPKVLTVDNVETKIDGSSIYVATDSQEPVSLFVSDEESGGSASLQLMPQELDRPVEVTLAPMPGVGQGTKGEPAKETKLFKQDSAYIAEIKSVMQAMGRKQVPDGFNLASDGDIARYSNLCQGAGLAFRAGQLLKSDQAQIVVFVAENKGTMQVQFEESFCASEDTVAVAAWPRFRLNSGERTEVFVLLRKQQFRDNAAPRPSLLDGVAYEH